MTAFDKKKLFLSIISTTVAILLLGYSAYGWMSLNREVKATGMNVNAIVPDGIEISLTENGVYSQSVNVDLKTIVEELTAGEANQFDADNDEFFLYPASSYEGLTTWATNESDSAGAAICAENEFKVGHSINYNDDERFYEGHYIDVTLWLRTPSDEMSSVRLNHATTVITSVDSTEIDRIVRCAFLNPDKTAVSYDGNANYTDALVFADTARSNTSAVVTKHSTLNQSAYIAPKYLTYTTNPNISDQIILQIPASGDDLYAKACFVVRIWIEGQDSACVASLGSKNFNLTLGFTVEEP